MKEIAQSYFKCDFSNPERIVIVGDRLATDIMLGNLNNMTTIYVQPFKIHWKEISFKFRSLLRVE